MPIIFDRLWAIAPFSPTSSNSLQEANMAKYHKYAAAVLLAGALQASVAQAQLNNVIDCAQYPATEASERAEEYLPDCRSWAQSRGYGDAVVLPMDTAENEVELASQPLTCPTLKEGNVGYYCIGLDKAAR
jgi:hypothetical protein